MVKVVVDFRRNDDGEYCTIEHHARNEREARVWAAKMGRSLEKSGDLVKTIRMFFVKDAQNEKEDKEQ